ncbi:hypothetical protein Lalb_Chr12g0204301 [Lupinus albus]|uniref:Uncharacterized protein n=1 Tax=Lupinus albus TaxID=3870 RepID=A0A6A4PNQ5_LUPAL|nr:hypothetical protein Lalb_Chr12g0204301 [Lupinus albus]
MLTTKHHFKAWVSSTSQFFFIFLGMVYFKTKRLNLSRIQILEITSPLTG